MKKEDAIKFLPFVSALAEGKLIQIKNPDGTWADLDDPNFNRSPDLYRIKPVPLEMWLTLASVGNACLFVSDDKTLNEAVYPHRTPRLFREVIE